MSCPGEAKDCSREADYGLPGPPGLGDVAGRCPVPAGCSRAGEGAQHREGVLEQALDSW